MNQRVKELAEAIGARVIGDDHVELSGVASITSARVRDIVFVEDEKHLQSALQSNATAVITGSFAENAASSKPLLIASNPRLAFARASQLLSANLRRQEGTHPSAVVLPSAKIAESVVIDPWTFVGENAAIGNRTWIGAGSVIGRDVSIGEDCKIYPRVTIYPGTRIGNRVIVHAGAVLGSDGFGYVRDPAKGSYETFPQIGQLIIEDDVEIGANTTIDRGALETTRIGRGTKIDNLVHIGHNCQIGEHAHIGEGVMIGGQGGVLPKKILRGKGIAFWGTPAKPLREYLKSLAVLAKLGKKGEFTITK